MIEVASLSRAAARISWAVLLLAAFDLAFRSLVWASWIPAPGEPYGASDLIELVTGCLLVLLCIACVVLGVILAVRSPIIGLRHVAIGVIVPVTYTFIYPHLPLLQLW